MKKIIFLLIISAFLITGCRALAEENFPDPGTLPDSTFYFLKSWKESIQTFFIFGTENKVEQFMHLAEVRLAEYQKMIEKGKTEIAEKTLEKYEKQLSHAIEKAEEAKEKGKDVEKLKEVISEKIIKHQEVLIEVLNKVPEEAKKGIENAIEISQKGFENAIQAVTGEKKDELERKAEEVKNRIEEKRETPEVCIQVITPAIGPDNKCKEFPTPCDVPAGWKKVNKCPAVSAPSTPSASPKPISSPTPNTSLPWVTGTLQLEFPSIFLAGQPIMMRSLGSPSSMPQPVAEQRPTLQSMDDDQWCAKKRMRVNDYGVKYILEMLGVETVKVGSVDCRACHIRKFSEDGIFAAERWDDMYFWYLQKLSGKWACEKSINYKNFIGDEWTDYYQISESWSPQNFYYQCVKKEGKYVSGNEDYCEKGAPGTVILPSPAATPSTPTPAPAPASTESGIACCVQGEVCKVFPTEGGEDYNQMVEQCRSEGRLTGASTCSPNPCQPFPVSTKIITTPYDVSCRTGQMKDYKCSDGTLIKWQCKCRLEADGEETRYCVVNPAEICFVSASSAPLTINWIQTRYDTWEQVTGAEKSISMKIFWTTNKPATSWIEYGPTTAYGSKTSLSPFSPNYNHNVLGFSGQQRNTTYHFRIIAEDAQGHKIVSDDYTFTTGL